LLLVIFWVIPVLGLFVSSFRTRDDIQSSGWWSLLPHQEWTVVDEIDPQEEGLDADGVMNVGGVEATFEELREGVTTEDGQRLLWVGNRRLGTIEVQEEEWTVNWDFTVNNYQQVLAGRELEVAGETVRGETMGPAFLNSLAVAIPATIIPILIAAFAAYAFAWMKFPGRKASFVIVVAMLVVPLQIALIPVLSVYRRLELNGTYLGIWLAHAGFGIALATYLLFNYIRGLPRETLESAFIDGASHFTIFVRLILPLSVPALASFAIFQFLWVWNDFLVALIFLGGAPEAEVVTMRLAEITGSRGQDWHLLTAGAFVTMILPLLVFFGLQRYFVRGLMAGSVKG
jgi:alpha-glucoside transport system permease protein